jgi:hypothetical protein
MYNINRPVIIICISILIPKRGYTWGGVIVGGCYGVIADATGNSCVVGNFKGAIDFDPGPGEDMHTSAGTLTEAFLSKLPPGGYWWS